MATFKVPGSLCASDRRNIIFGNAFDRSCSEAIVNPQLEGIEVPLDLDEQDEDHTMLAALAYGEASTKDVYEEMAAIANVVVRQMKARGYTSVKSFLKTNATYAYAANGSNQRFNRYSSAQLSSISQSPGMMLALRAAENALSADPFDYSAGAYFWEGRDFADKAKKGKGERYKQGVRITSKSHNIYDITQYSPGKVSRYIKDAKGHDTKTLRGEYEYAYETTAAYGGTMFMRYTPERLKADVHKEWK